MGITINAIEVTATVASQQHLELDEPLPINDQKRVRIIVLLGEETFEDSEIDEMTWLHAVAKNPAFDFLNNPEEDIYSWEDGKPLSDEI